MLLLEIAILVAVVLFAGVLMHYLFFGPGSSRYYR